MYDIIEVALKVELTMDLMPRVSKYLIMVVSVSRHRIGHCIECVKLLNNIFETILSWEDVHASIFEDIL